MRATVKPPVWFRVAAIVLMLWSIAGVVGFHTDLARTPADLAQFDAYDRQLYTGRPGWFIIVYGVAVWAGLIGSVALLLRRRWAREACIASLIAVTVMFGRMFVATDIIAVKGVLVAAGFPVVIASIAAAEAWLASLAIRRGWIG